MMLQRKRDGAQDAVLHSVTSLAHVLEEDRTDRIVTTY